MVFITVFTPTYNRGSLLYRLFNSLCRQTYKKFEWLIVDDGSTDNTEEIVDEFSTFVSNRADVDFSIRYYKEANGGKHRAINFGVKVAKGDLFFIADSDDKLPDNSLQIVASQWEPICGDTSFAGVCGLDATFSGKLVSHRLVSNVIDCNSLDARFRMGMKGDMKEVYRTKALVEFPFPEIEGERFCPELLVWNRIGEKYKLRYFNKVIYLVEYQETGISSNILKVRMLSPVASTMTYRELAMHEEIPVYWKVKAAVNYWRFRCCINKNKGKLHAIPKLAGWLNLFAPIGYIMHTFDKYFIAR